MQSENEGKWQIGAIRFGPSKVIPMTPPDWRGMSRMSSFWTQVEKQMGKQMPPHRSIPNPTVEHCTSPESSPQNALPELLPAILQLVEQMAQTNEYLAQIISQDYADDSSSETGSDETLTGKPGRIISQREFRAKGG